MRALWKFLKRQLQYPRVIRLEGPGGILKFKVFNPTEKYRITEYGGEREFLRRFVSEITDDDRVFDIGASVGLMTVFAAAQATRGMIIAFEPDPETCSRLRKNVAINQFSNVRIVPWAVGDREEEATLYSDGSSGLAPTLREQPDRPGAPTGEVMVQMRTLDKALEQGRLPLPSILKIDVEGAEIICLKGAIKLLQGKLGRKPRMIFIELHPTFLPNFESSDEEVYRILHDAGYRAEWRMERKDQIHLCYVPAGTTVRL